MPDFPELVAAELARARAVNPLFHTRHEGLAVIEEEFLELRTEVFQREPLAGRLLEELVQVAAMCQRFAEDLLDCRPSVANLDPRWRLLIERIRLLDERFGHFGGIGRDLGGPLEALGGLAAEIHALAAETQPPAPDPQPLP